MGKVLQEKFQIHAPNQPDGENEWISRKRVAVKKGTPGREGRSGGDPPSKTMDNAVQYGTLPPGMDIEDQEIADIRVQDEVHLSGTTDVSKNTNSESLAKGYSRKELRSTDDQYTREHNDAFYEDVTVDGVTGFLERNNVLDRL